MLRIVLALTFSLLQLAPAAALAAEPLVVTWRHYEITGLVLGDEAIAAAGKLSLGSNAALSATVGCNSIGATAAETDTGTYRIADVLSTTMACDGSLMVAEGALLKILSAGELTLATDELSNGSGRILLRAAGTSETVEPGTVDPESPVSTSAPDATGAPGPVDEVPSFSIEQCVGVLSDEELAPYLGRPIDGTVSSGSGSSGSGSAGGSGGGVVEPVPSAGEEPPPVVIEPVPPVVVEPVPSAVVEPPKVPDASLVVDPVPVPVDPVPVPVDPVPVPVDPGTEQEAPAPGVPGPVPTVEDCRALLASIRTFGSGEAMPPVMANDSVAGAASGAARDSSSGGSSGMLLAVGATALLAAAVALLLVRRRRPREE